LGGRVARRRAGQSRAPGACGGRAVVRRGTADAEGSGVIARVGVVGCGIVAKVYVEGSTAFDSFEVTACADLERECADAFADLHGLRASTVDELLADSSIDVVLNLTPPAAHAAVIRAAPEAGKPVYTVKPVTTTLADGRELLAEAERRGLRIGCAPDTFL